MADRLASRFASPQDSPGLLLWRATHRWQARQRAALKPLGLTHVQFVLLAALAWRAEPVTQRALADDAVLDVMMTSQVLRTLEERGLVRRDEHPGDRRARAVVVTAEGRALADRAVVVVEATDEAFFAALGEQAARLTPLLGRLAGQP